MQEKQNDLTSHYNLFSNQPPTFFKTIRSRQLEKAQIKIVFQHPNLLYLSDKRVKTKQEISEEVQKRLIHMIKNKVQSKKQLKTNVRPATSYFDDVKNKTDFDFKEQAFRCMTSAQLCGGRKRRRKIVLQSYSKKLSFQQEALSAQRQVFFFENNLEMENQQKNKIITRFVKKQRLSSEPKLNMYIEMQRKIFNYKNRTRKPDMKNSRNKTLQYF